MLHHTLSLKDSREIELIRKHEQINQSVKRTVINARVYESIQRYIDSRIDFRDLYRLRESNPLPLIVIIL